MAPADKKKTAGQAATKLPVENGAAEAKEEAELNASLMRLAAAQEQLSELRLSMHKMLQPLHSTAADPELVYAAFADSAQKVVRDIREFKTSMREEKMQKLLERSKEWIVKSENGIGWMGELNNNGIDEETGAALNGVDALKIEAHDTPKKS